MAANPEPRYCCDHNTEPLPPTSISIPPTLFTIIALFPGIGFLLKKDQASSISPAIAKRIAPIRYGGIVANPNCAAR